MWYAGIDRSHLPNLRNSTTCRWLVQSINTSWQHVVRMRANIPTEELRDFVADEEKEPETILYPRDPSLDPQLVWKGKDEQDSKPLEVPSVPVYIQEKIQPQAIIEEVRNQAKKDEPADQLSIVKP